MFLQEALIPTSKLHFLLLSSFLLEKEKKGWGGGLGGVGGGGGAWEENIFDFGVMM